MVEADGRYEKHVAIGRELCFEIGATGPNIRNILFIPCKRLTIAATRARRFDKVEHLPKAMPAVLRCCDNVAWTVRFRVLNGTDVNHARKTAWSVL